MHVVTVAEFRTSFLISLEVGVAATCIALLLGIPAAYALSRYRFAGSDSIRAMLTTPVIVPGIVVGLGLLRYLVVPINASVLLGLLLAHTALVIPYAVRVVSASLENLQSDVEDAAVVLGATRLQAFFKVVVPNIRGGIIAAFVLAFITSFNQIPVSLFLAGPGVSTLPIEMLHYTELNFDPGTAALSFLLALFSVVLVYGAERGLGLSRYL
jgi:putative spermidine/putrescine transport system permease protein